MLQIAVTKVICFDNIYRLKLNMLVLKIIDFTEVNPVVNMFKGHSNEGHHLIRGCFLRTM